jgi:TatD DNase family protein
VTEGYTRARGDAGRSSDLARPGAPAGLPLPVVDTHCHLDIRDGDDDGFGPREAVAAAAAVNVTHIVQVGCDLASARWSVAFAREVESVVATVALHPNEAPRLLAEGGQVALDDAMAEIASLAADPQVRAVGETGLDFFRTGPEGREVQEHAFREHIRLARRLGKPLVIHDRDAHDDVLRVLADEPLPESVVFHCFSGDVTMARTCAENGWYVSVAGVVTFKNAASLREAVAVVPPAQLLVETDAPYLTPMPYRGRPNASYLVPLTVAALAEVQQRPVEAVCADLWAASQRVFGPFSG